MEIDKLTIAELKSLMAFFSQNALQASPFKVGDKLFIRTVTYHVTGRVVEVCGKFLRLADAAWIADDGRFMQAIRDGVLNEVEPVFVDTFVNTDSFIDVYYWNHPLPREQK